MVARESRWVELSKSTWCLPQFQLCWKDPSWYPTLPPWWETEWDGSRRLTFPLAVVVDPFCQEWKWKLGPPTTFGYSGSRFCSHFPLFGHNKCISRAPGEWPLEVDCVLLHVLYSGHEDGPFTLTISGHWHPIHPHPATTLPAQCFHVGRQKSDWREKCAPGVSFQCLHSSCL